VWKGPNPLEHPGGTRRSKTGGEDRRTSIFSNFRDARAGSSYIQLNLEIGAPLLRSAGEVPLAAWGWSERGAENRRPSCASCRASWTTNAGGVFHPGRYHPGTGRPVPALPQLRRGANTPYFQMARQKVTRHRSPTAWKPSGLN